MVPPLARVVQHVLIADLRSGHVFRFDERSRKPRCKQAADQLQPGDDGALVGGVAEIVWDDRRAVGFAERSRLPRLSGRNW